MIVEELNNIENSNIVYAYIYQNVISRCVKLIEEEKYELAYSVYKNIITGLEDELITKKLVEKQKTLYLKQPF